MAAEPYPYDELIMGPAEPWPYPYDELVMGPEPEELFPFSDDWWRQLEEDGGQPWSQSQEEEFRELLPIPLPDDDDPAAAAPPAPAWWLPLPPAAADAHHQLPQPLPPPEEEGHAVFDAPPPQAWVVPPPPAAADAHQLRLPPPEEEAGDDVLDGQWMQEGGNDGEPYQLPQLLPPEEAGYDVFDFDGQWGHEGGDGGPYHFPLPPLSPVEAGYDVFDGQWMQEGDDDGEPWSQPYMAPPDDQWMQRLLDYFYEYQHDHYPIGRRPV